MLDDDTRFSFVLPSSIVMAKLDANLDAIISSLDANLDVDVRLSSPFPGLP